MMGSPWLQRRIYRCPACQATYLHDRGHAHAMHLPRAPGGAARAPTRSRENLLSGHREGPAMNGLANSPTIDELLTNPAKAASLPPATAQALLITLAAIQPLLIQRALMGNQNEHADKELLTVPEAAERLKLSAYRVYELIREGHLKRIPIGKAVRVKVSDLNEFIAKQGS